MPPLKLCLIGCGRIAQVHARGLELECKGLIEVTACVDSYAPRARELAVQFGDQCEVYESLDEALQKGDFSAVDIMLPHHFHELVSNVVILQVLKRYLAR